MEEIVQLRKEKDHLERELQRKEAQLQIAQEDIQKNVLVIQNNETKLQMLKSQVCM